MKVRLLSISILATLLVLAPFAVRAQEEDGVQGEIEIGAWDDSVDGTPNLAAEYEPTDGGPLLDMNIESFQDGGSFVLDSEVLSSDFQSHLIDFELRRMVRSVTTYNALLHRLGHDPLSNLAAVTNHGRVLRHTDNDPTREYQVDYKVLDNVTELQFPGASALTVTAGYRRQDKEGFRQQTTVSHCDGCHVVSQSRRIDETTEDLNLAAEIAWMGGTVRASYNHRELDDRGPDLTLLFDDALHPELRAPVFDNRLQFDSAEGPQPVDARPDIEKDTVKLGANWASVGGFAISASGVWADTENMATGLQSDYTGYAVNASRRFDNGVNLRWRGHGYTLDNDDVFVNVIERPGKAGPQAGGIFSDYWPDAPLDFVRKSALNREVFDSKLDLGYRMGRKKGTLRFIWDWETVDRDNFEVAPGETETTTNILGLNWTSRPKKGARLNASFRHGSVDSPFMNVDGSHSTLISTKVANPFDPRAAQYYESHDARIADVTAEPESWDELKLRGSYQFGKASLTASYRWWDGDNSDGNLTDWAKTNQAATVSLWAAQNSHVQWHLTYARHDNELDFATSIPIFDG